MNVNSLDIIDCAPNTINIREIRVCLLRDSHPTKYICNNSNRILYKTGIYILYYQIAKVNLINYFQHE